MYNFIVTMHLDQMSPNAQCSCFEVLWGNLTTEQTVLQWIQVWFQQQLISRPVKSGLQLSAEIGNSTLALEYFDKYIGSVWQTCESCPVVLPVLV